MKKIFITGESGVIPMAIQKLAKDFDCYIVNNQFVDQYNLDALKHHNAFKIRKPEIDFTDLEVLECAIQMSQPDIIIHSGAFVGTDYCFNSKEDSIKSNVYGTQNVVDLCNKYKIKLIYFSTTAIFDVNDYRKNRHITEGTKINPQTLYGITKYAGEQIVDKLCETDKIIVRPVFGFGNYPDDLHSAITKLIYSMHNKEKNKLDILLDINIMKNYYRVENLATIVLQLIQKDIWNEKVNIGENWDERKDWHYIISTIRHNSKDCVNYNLQNINFINQRDYLHWHNIDNIWMRSLIGGVQNEISFDDGIRMTIESVKNNLNVKPYWI